MDKITSSIFEIGRLDRLARQDTWVHRLDPRTKLLTTLAFIVAVLSFDRYEIFGLVPFLFYPLALAVLGNVTIRYLVARILVVMPFAIMVGILNPVFDRDPSIALGSFVLSGGWVSFISILERTILTTGAVFALLAVTGIEPFAQALSRLGVPSIFAQQIMFLYRYIFVLMDEGQRIVRARALRSFGQSGAGIKIYGALLGSLLVRTLDRAERIHKAMACRGFTGIVRTMNVHKFGALDAAFFVSWCLVFLILRTNDLTFWLGGAFS